MKKRVCTVLLLLALALAVFGLLAAAEEAPASSGTVGSISWSFAEDTGTLTISGTGEMPGYDNAEKLPWYAIREGITTVVVEDGITALGKRAFSQCTELERVTLPNTLTKISTLTFEYCGSLTAVRIPDSVTTLEGRAFECCYHLQSVTLSKSLTKIENDAFYGCSALEEIEIPEGVTSIGSCAFYACNSLRSIKLPQKLSELKGSAFAGCDSLKELIIPGGITKIESSLVSGCRNLERIVLSEGTTEIGDDAFMGCRALKEVVIPEGVTKLGMRVFAYCTSLERAEFPQSLQEIGVFLMDDTPMYDDPNNWENGVMYYDNCIITVKSDEVKGDYTIRSGTRLIAERAFMQCDGLDEIQIPGSVTRIPELAFYNCEGLRKVVLGSGITEIERSAFAECGDLETVFLPDSVERIESWAFDNCAIREIRLPESLTYIGGKAFRLCLLSEITIPKGVQEIGDEAFFGNHGLRKVYFKGNAPEFGDFVFYDTDIYSRKIYPRDLVIYYIQGKSGWSSPEWKGYRSKAWTGSGQETASGTSFVDLEEGAYYGTAVRWAVTMDITSGVDATHFAPNGTCTRAQVVAFLWRAAGKPEPKTTNNPFTDVSSGDYFYKAVLWAAENGIVYGTDAAHFTPGASCTRAQVVCFLYRYRNSPGHGTNKPFRDVKDGAYYYDAVLWAAENGVVYGTDTTHFSPDKTCTRAQVVTFLYRLLG